MENNFIDLGLPSGTLWADKNVGASSPEDNGDYFTFDEAQELGPKDNGGYFTFEEAQELGKVPDKGQFEELKNECKWTWKGEGYEVTGPNGNSIFLPAVGYRYVIGVRYVGSYGFYWSSTVDGKYDAYYLSFDSDSTHMNCYDSRSTGLSVRLVR